MHEGAAESFSLTVLRNFGIIHQTRYLELVSQNLNKCINGLNGISRQESASKKWFKNYYTCGAHVGFITENAISQSSGEKYNIVEFWKKLFDESVKNNNSYTEEIYFSLLNDKTKNIKLTNEIKKIINEPIENVGDNLASLVKELGLNVILQTNNYSKEIALCDCENNKCRYIKEKINVGRVNDISVLKYGVAACDSAFKKANENKSIVI